MDITTISLFSRITISIIYISGVAYIIFGNTQTSIMRGIGFVLVAATMTVLALNN